MKFSVIMACHNRRALTVNSILAAQKAANHAAIEIKYVIFDDGSTDSTGESVNRLCLPVEIIRGDGNAYWAKSMAIAEKRVMATFENDDDSYIVWLNDDVVLDADAFISVCEEIERHPSTVIVGAMREPSTGEVSYSGMVWKGPHPLSFNRLVPNPKKKSQVVDTFNGNFVIVPISVAREIGGIDGNFSHALADIDYGLRCKRLGIPMVLASKTVGECPRNEESSEKSLLEDWKRYIDVKGAGNFRSLKLILKKNHSVFWILPILSSYGLWWTRRFINTKGIRRIAS